MRKTCSFYETLRKDGFINSEWCHGNSNQSVKKWAYQFSTAEEHVPWHFPLNFESKKDHVLTSHTKISFMTSWLKLHNQRVTREIADCVQIAPVDRLMSLLHHRDFFLSSRLRVCHNSSGFHVFYEIGHLCNHPMTEKSFYQSKHQLEKSFHQSKHPLSEAETRSCVLKSLPPPGREQTHVNNQANKVE